MSHAKFIQIHSLHGYSATLLNRDDSGLSKRISYGGKSRTRISSQCLKRHWRVAKDINAIEAISTDAAAVRSRETVTRKVIQPLLDMGVDKDVVEAIEEQFQLAVYGEKGTSIKSRQPLLLGQPEITYLANEARQIAKGNLSSAEDAKKSAEEWRKKYRDNMKTLRSNCELPGGMASALFGRMVTSDVEANIDAAIYVAHAFTVHAEQTESDYFTVVDDLQQVEDDAGADHIGETELSSGLFYGYVVIDRDTLINNLGDDVSLAGEVAACLIRLIATVSPGAKLGSTAPFGYAGWMMAEAGERQPRSLAEAFRTPCEPTLDKAVSEIQKYIKQIDKCYGDHEIRRVMSFSQASEPDDKHVDLEKLSQWVAKAIQGDSA
ncbi:MAG: type I-E CRISPR-associated protein Cas7/Cse4/CasC [Gammaproteobacteria bacterium]|nr:type I-E CRISPR-associated protein Cas7/Cse4/CasC [Gammaproteobacteria bacterium]